MNWYRWLVTLFVAPALAACAQGAKSPTRPTHRRMCTTGAVMAEASGACSGQGPASTASQMPRGSPRTSAIGRTGGAFENLVEQYPGKYSDTLFERLQAGRKLSLDDYRLRLLQREETKNRLAAIAPLAEALISPRLARSCPSRPR